ncbi:MAG TPA: hypothetical protein DGG94_06920 [Micromonosporaceae bacterium]|nr:hypothetical protein [Micromonosporaceae bacterium]HCU49519.1 hypothetical protein [Micromonosporaceae bacterium]
MSRRLGLWLSEWATAEELRSRKWAGEVTLGWIAMCCLGYAFRDGGQHIKLAAVLNSWPATERDALLGWARHETWFEGL